MAGGGVTLHAGGQSKQLPLTRIHVDTLNNMHSQCVRAYVCVRLRSEVRDG